MGWQILFPSGPSGELRALEPQPLDRTSVPPVTAEPPAEAVAPDPEPEVVADPMGPSPSNNTALDDEQSGALAKQAVEQGTRLFDNGEYVQAMAQFREARDLDPGNLDAKDWETKTAAEVHRAEVWEREISTTRAALGDHDYESALKKLYRMDPPTEAGEAMVHHWIVTCWYNWGVLRLQSGRLRDAEEKFQEVLGLEPDDEDVINHLEVVRRYRSLPTDATFKSYTSRVTLRELD
jgi:tetratricopeptide (TPR) repeat protein